MDDVFDSLRALMVRQTERLHITDDDPGKLRIEGDEIGGKREWFGAVQTKKNYVSFHLMQVYCEPELLDDVSADLKKRMQGKSCFNFKQTDDELFAELERLTARCVDHFVTG